MANNLDIPFSDALWRVELESDKIGYIADKISKISKVVKEQLDSS